MRTKRWLELSEAEVTEIISSDTFNAKEGEIFDGVVSWGKAEAKRQKKDPSKTEDVKEVTKNVFLLVRLPLLEVKDIAVSLEKSGLLSEDQMLDLFTYLGSKSISCVKPGASLKLFSSKPRKGRTPIGAFRFDPEHKGAALVLSNDDRTVKQSYGNSQWNSCSCTTWLSEGVHKVKFRIDNSTGSQWIFLGAISRSYSGWTDTSSGYVGCNSTAYGFSSGGGTSYKYPGSTSYGRTFRTGEVITMNVDMDAKTIGFAIGESDFGTAFTGVVSEVCPAITTYDINDQISFVSSDDEVPSSDSSSASSSSSSSSTTTAAAEW